MSDEALPALQLIYYPPGPGTKEFEEALVQVKEIGSITSATRTEEQTRIIWADRLRCGR